MFGHTLYTCPEHRKLGEVFTPDVREPGQAREQVRAMLEARRQALARETEKAPLPPRPPYNIGHYADPRHRPRNPGMGQ